MQLEAYMVSSAEKTILVVDDEPDIREFFRFALLNAGFKVATAEDGYEALEVIRRRKPDLISLDLVMPRKSVVVFYRDLIKNRDWSDIPVMIVTGHARDDLGRADLKELTVSGPGIYLEKPVKAKDYVAAVRQILGMDGGA